MKLKDKPKDLTNKMLDLMTKLAEYDFLSIPEAQQIYSNQTHAYRVLNKLKKRGWALAFGTGTKPRTAFCLSPNGYRMLGQYGKLRTRGRFKPEDFKPHIFRHRTLCARLGMALERHPSVRDFLPEKFLWERDDWRNKKVCDAEFWYKPGEGRASLRVGLEVELTLKNGDKLADSFRGLGRREDLDCVWWVYGSGKILGALRREIAKQPWDKPRHYLTRLEDALRAGRDWTLEDADGRRFTIAPDHATWPPPEPEPEPKPQRVVDPLDPYAPSDDDEEEDLSEYFHDYEADPQKPPGIVFPKGRPPSRTAQILFLVFIAAGVGIIAAIPLYYPYLP